MQNYDADKRLAQDRIEREKKENASTGMWLAGLIILIGIIVGFYLYNRPAPVAVSNTTTHTVTNVPKNTKNTKTTEMTTTTTQAPATTSNR